MINTIAHPLAPFRPARLSSVALALLLLAPAPLNAQRVDENAAADAEDAFGSNDGGDTLGIYGPQDVRGFSPLDAGNVRINGLYVDRQSDFNNRLVEGNRIRVGPSVIGYIFPAPSGIVDYRLRTPSERSVKSVLLQTSSRGAFRGEIDANIPISDNLGLAAGAGFSRNEYASGNNADVSTLAVIGKWTPSDAITVQPFWSRTRISDEEIYPIIVGDGAGTPPHLKRRHYLGQPWAEVETERFNYGVVANSKISGFNLRAGAFRSTSTVLQGYSLFLNVPEGDGLGARAAVANPRRTSGSTSGEIALSRQFRVGRLLNELTLVARGRSQRRIYGGGQRVALAPAPFGTQSFVERPDFRYSAQSLDKVQQWTVGLTWLSKLDDLGQVNVGIQRSDYRKAVNSAGEEKPESRSRPWLFNGGATVNLTPNLSLYANYTRGLEESEVAPETAINFNDAPPAIQTKQVDAGLQWKWKSLILIAGGFEIRKPYYGLDANNYFGRLGQVRHRGLEFSLTGKPVEGLTLVAGGVFLDPRLSGIEVVSGAIGPKPLGTPSRTLTANIDWRPAQLKAFSFDITATHRGPSFGDVLNEVRVGPYNSVDLGIRYRFNLGRAPAVFRLQMTNIFNAYGWDVSGHNAFTYTDPRQAIARITVDF